MDNNNIIDRISIDRLNTIEEQRERTMGLREFQQWMQELHVSRLAPKNPEGKQRARDMMEDWIAREEQASQRWPEFVRRWF